MVGLPTCGDRPAVGAVGYPECLERKSSADGSLGSDLASKGILDTVVAKEDTPACPGTAGGGKGKRARLSPFEPKGSMARMGLGDTGASRRTRRTLLSKEQKSSGFGGRVFLGCILGSTVDQACSGSAFVQRIRAGKWCWSLRSPKDAAVVVLQLKAKIASLQ